MKPTQRIAIEERSGIWLLFHEKLNLCSSPKGKKNTYQQRLVRIFKDFDTAEKAAFLEFCKWQISASLIVRDDSEKDLLVRQ